MLGVYLHLMVPLTVFNEVGADVADYDRDEQGLLAKNANFFATESG